MDNDLGLHSAAVSAHIPSHPQILEVTARLVDVASPSSIRIQVRTSVTCLADFCAARNLECELDPSLFTGALCVTDCRSVDNPIVWASPEFLALTGYTEDEVLGRNCRFLQGPATAASDIETLRALVVSRSSGSVQILNYTKTGEAFWNLFAIFALRGPDGEVRYLAGGQSNQNVSCPARAVDSNDRVSAATLAVDASLSRLRLSAGNHEVCANGPPLLFSNEWASGNIRISTRTNPPDPRVKGFFDENHNRRVLYLQLTLEPKKRLDFKHTIFIGGEVPRGMRLGWKMGVAANVLVRLLKVSEPRVQCSFGNTDAGERGHIFFPWSTMGEWVTVSTPCDDAGLATGAADTGSAALHGRGDDLAMGRTYTINIGSVIFDLENWQIGNLPGIGSLKLEQFWEDMPLHLVVYALPDGEGSHDPSRCVRFCDIKIRRQI